MTLTLVGPASRYMTEGELLIAKKKYQQALVAFSNAITVQPDLPSAYIALGGIYAKLGRHSVAAQMLIQALKIRPVRSAGTIAFQPLVKAACA